MTGDRRATKTPPSGGMTATPVDDAAFRTLFDHILASARRDDRTLGLAVMRSSEAIRPAVSEALLSASRETDVIGLSEGGEILILLNRLLSPADAETAVRRLLRRMDSLGARHVAPAVGVALFPDDGCVAEDLLTQAEAARRRATDQRLAYAFASFETEESLVDRLTLQEGFETGLSEGQISLDYQPQVRLADGEVLGAEALVRWEHPTLGAIGSRRLITLAEDMRKMFDLGAFVLKLATAQARAWTDDGRDQAEIAVNLTTRELLDRRLAGAVREALEETEVSPERLALELSEDSLMQNVDVAAEILPKLSEMGVRIVLDQFGTGYSSLVCLRLFPISEIKIDRAFVAECDVNDDDKAIVRAMMAMADVMGISATAVGVERQAQADFLAEAGCGKAQGSLFGAPTPASEFSFGD